MTEQKKGLSLGLVFKIFAVLQFLQGLLMLFGSQFSESSKSMISEMNVWDDSIGITTMAEHHGAGLICIGIFFWFLPSWMKGNNLKATVPATIITQFILLIMPIYHAAIGAFPIDPSFYVMIAIFTGFIILTYISSRNFS